MATVFVLVCLCDFVIFLSAHLSSSSEVKKLATLQLADLWQTALVYKIAELYDIVIVCFHSSVILNSTKLT